jgi:hypothetical protein
MKMWLTASLVLAITIVAGVAVQADPVPPPPPIPVPAPGMIKDGPFHLLVAAKAHARHRRVQGYRTDIVVENGLWYVVCYN